jgi:mannose-6-phosphate isomerase-like protein (cupin superfamily)
MQVIRGNQIPYQPASHENPADPGVFKRVLCPKHLLNAGRAQMVNWARIPAGKSFRRHFHEDMQEIFVILDGTVEMNVGGFACRLDAGDAILIEAMEVHRMTNPGSQDVNYIVIGISGETGGKTVVCEVSGQPS